MGQRRTREIGAYLTSEALAFGSPIASIGICGGPAVVGRQIRSDTSKLGGMEKLTFAQPIELRSFASRIEHTLLRPDAIPADIERLCAEAERWSFVTVCVNSAYTKLAFDLLSQSSVAVTTTVAFPFGASSTTAKVREAMQAIQDGASELDVVIEIGWLKGGRDDLIRTELSVLRSATEGRTLKVILEAGFLNDEQKVRGARLASEAGADFVKTSTGYGPSGATPGDVSLLRKVLPAQVRIKAAGGIRTVAQAQALIDAGADRLGASRGVQLADELRRQIAG